MIKGSLNCLSIVKIGFKDVIGSWKITEISFPRILHISFNDTSARFFPSKRISPLSMYPFPSKSLRILIAETLFPLPDSPTTPRVFPASTE